MFGQESLIAEYGRLVVEAALAVSTIILGWLTYRKNNKIKRLERDKEYLKETIHKVTSKVNPESDRLLLIEARESLGIMGINALGPLHHCREELIAFLTDRKGTLRIVLLDPTSDAFATRKQKEGDASQRLLSEWCASISILQDIQRRTNGDVELRLHSDTPECSLFIIDGLEQPTDRTKMLINYYPEEENTRGYAGAQFLADFKMERDRDSIFKNTDRFSKCWERATPIAASAALDLVRVP